MGTRQQRGIDDLSFCGFRGVNVKLCQAEGQCLEERITEFSIDYITCHTIYFG